MRKRLTLALIPGALTALLLTGNPIRMAAQNAPGFSAEALDRRLGDFERSQNRGRVAVLLADPDALRVLYVYNRDYVLRRVFPVGSLMKPLTATVLMETPGFRPERRVRCDGRYRLPPGLAGPRDDRLFSLGREGDRRYFRCSLRHGHGSVDLREALVRSCNVYFLTMAGKHPESYTRLRARWRLDSATGATGLGQERASLAARPRDLTAFGRMAAGIGEGGGVRLTPLKVAQTYGALFTGSPLLRPTVRESTAGRRAQFETPFSGPTTRRIAEFLGRVPLHGTLRGLRISGKDSRLLGAKTGTATHYRKKYTNHGWNVIHFRRGPAPYLLVSFVERGSGGKEARELSQMILSEIRTHQKQPF